MRITYDTRQSINDSVKEWKESIGLYDPATGDRLDRLSSSHLAAWMEDVLYDLDQVNFDLIKEKHERRRLQSELDGLKLKMKGINHVI